MIKLKEQMTLYNDVYHLIKHHEKFSKSYFWSPPLVDRAGWGKTNSVNTTIEYNNNVYTIIMDVSASSRNVYYTSTFTLNGEKKNITILKKLREKILEDINKKTKGRYIVTTSEKLRRYAKYTLGDKYYIPERLSTHIFEAFL